MRGDSSAAGCSLDARGGSAFPVFHRFLLPCALAAAVCCGCSAPEPVRAVTFNIRYGTAPDGVHRWESRRDLLLQTLRTLDPDVLGLQEVLAFQADVLREALPEYGFVGVGRDDGREGGEFAPILYRKRRFTPVASGYFWLSPDSRTPGSVGWDAALTRMVTWVRLQFRENPLVSCTVLNTHLDHRGSVARAESAKLLRRTIEALGGTPVVLLGDFNCTPGSPPYDTLTLPWGNGGELLDTFSLAQDSAGGSGTFHGFRGTRDGGRIDWILVNRRWRVLHCEIDHSQQEGRYPSDHFPVAATLEYLPVTGMGGV